MTADEFRLCAHREPSLRTSRMAALRLQIGHTAGRTSYQGIGFERIDVSLRRRLRSSNRLTVPLSAAA